MRRYQFEWLKRESIYGSTATFRPARLAKMLGAIVLYKNYLKVKGESGNLSVSSHPDVLVSSRNCCAIASRDMAAGEPMGALLFGV